jgi:hypothetical protein
MGWHVVINNRKPLSYHSQDNAVYRRFEGQYVQTKFTEDRMNGVATFTHDTEQFLRSQKRMHSQYEKRENRRRLKNEAKLEPNSWHDEYSRVKEKMRMLGQAEHCERFEEEAERAGGRGYRWGR